MADLSAVAVEKTPTFFVDGKPLARFHPDELRQMVQRDIKQAGRQPSR